MIITQAQTPAQKVVAYYKKKKKRIVNIADCLLFLIQTSEQNSWRAEESACVLVSSI